MKKSSFFYVVILCIFLCSCTEKTKESEKVNWTSFIKPALTTEWTGNNGKHLCLLIADDMCSECIVKEYMNIKNDSIEDIYIVGIFGDKRHFAASASPFPQSRVFIDRKHCRITRLSSINQFTLSMMERREIYRKYFIRFHVNRIKR